MVVLARQKRARKKPEINIFKMYIIMENKLKCKTENYPVLKGAQSLLISQRDFNRTISTFRIAGETAIYPHVKR